VSTNGWTPHERLVVSEAVPMQCITAASSSGG
jgi:hypothetical protein